MAKILLVEDDTDLAARLKDWFSLDNHLVEDVTTGEDALQMLRNYTFDIVVLDWSLPGMPGIEVCKKYRSEGGKTPILFLTGKVDVDDKETGLDAGADDYLTKPFDTRELSARIRSILRRPPTMLATDLRVGAVILRPDTRTVTAGDASAHLKPKECALLEFLMRHPDKLFSAKELLEAVWPSDTDASSDSVRTWMKLLRRQLGTIGRPDMIKTVLGSGYMLDSSG